MPQEEEKDIFGHTGAILIRNVLVNREPVDISINERGLIEAVGKEAGREVRGEDVIEIHGKKAIVFPGLVNTHTHAAMTLLRGYADDMNLRDWLEHKIWPLEAHLSGEDIYWGTKLACLEMIKSGTTCFNDMYFYMKDAARAVAETGLKAVLAYGFIDKGDEERCEREIKATVEFCEDIRRLNNPMIHAALGPHAVYTVSREALQWMAAYSRDKGLGIHLHLSETEKEVRDCIIAHGLSPAALLDDCQILTSRTVAAHCCWLTREECTLLGRRGVHVAHCPVSNMKLAVNRAMPYHHLLDNGVNLTLGTDGCASNNSLDLFETMKCASLLQKFFWNSETILPAGEALRMATSNGARALGMGSGRIEPGASADIILIDRNCACNTPLHTVESNMVYSCHGAAVKTVICGGRVLMYHRKVPGEAAVLRGAVRAAEQLIERANP